MRRILGSLCRAPAGTRYQPESVSPAAPDANSSQRAGIAPPKSVATSSSGTQRTFPKEIIEVILELLWRDIKLSTNYTRYRSYRALSSTSRSIRAIVQNLAIRYVVCTSILELGMYLNLALAHTRARALHVLPASIKLTTSPLYLVPLNAFLSSPQTYPLPCRAKKVLLKLRNVHNLGELPLFHDTQSCTLTLTLTSGTWPGQDWRLAHEWLTQAPTLTSMSFHDFDRTIMWTLIQWGEEDYAMRPRITHLTLSVSKENSSPAFIGPYCFLTSTPSSFTMVLRTWSSSTDPIQPRCSRPV
jgi:hypothetical protein